VSAGLDYCLSKARRNLLSLSVIRLRQQGLPRFSMNS